MTKAKDGHEAPGSGSHADVAPGGQQLALLPGQTDSERDELMPLGSNAETKSQATGVGRPRGAHNRRTDLVARYLVERYGDPLEGDVAFGMMPLRELIPTLRKIASDCGMEMALTVGDLLRLQGEARNRALPFIHAKRAPETEQGQAVPAMIGLMRAERRADGSTTLRSMEDMIEIEASPIEGVKDQGVSDAAQK